MKKTITEILEQTALEQAEFFALLGGIERKYI